MVLFRKLKVRNVSYKHHYLIIGTSRHGFISKTKSEKRFIQTSLLKNWYIKTHGFISKTKSEKRFIQTSLLNNWYIKTHGFISKPKSEKPYLSYKHNYLRIGTSIFFILHSGHPSFVSKSWYHVAIVNNYVLNWTKMRLGLNTRTKKCSLRRSKKLSCKF